jgi:cyclomaltodextrinase / maltogenic alpha-amylase / neopullulanase
MYRPEAIAVELNLLGSHDTPRFVTVAGGDRDAYRLALLAVMTLPGAPCIYYGDEVGMEGRHDPDNRDAFPWDESAWDHGSLALLKALTTLRSSHPYLRDAEFTVVGASADAVAYVRRSRGDGAIVAVNAGRASSRLDVELREPVQDVAHVELPGWAPPGVTADGARVSLEVAARSGAVVRFGRTA